jgi:hypothetical protein
MPRIFKKLSEQKMHDNPFTHKLQQLLQGIPNIDIKDLPQYMAAEQTFILICDTQEETTIIFELPKGSEERVTVRITQAHDLDKTDKRCYSAAARSRRAENRIEEHLNERQLEVEELQVIMARLFINTSATWPAKPSGIQNTSTASELLHNRISGWSCLQREEEKQEKPQSWCPGTRNSEKSWTH